MIMCIIIFMNRLVHVSSFFRSDTRITQDFIQRHIKLMKLALKTEEFLQDLNSYCNVVDVIDKIRRKCPGNL